MRAVLAAMGVPAGDEAEADAALGARRDAEAARLLPPVMVARRGDPASYRIPPPAVDATQAAAGEPAAGRLASAFVTCEDGTVHELVPDPEHPLAAPTDLPTGAHRLTVADPSGQRADATLLVAPQSCPVPPQHQWGWMVQLYGLRSTASWGIGDLADLRDLAAWTSGELGGDFVVTNPLHAADPVVPQQPSPYYPSSRRYANPLYLRIEDIPEVERLDAAARERVADLAATMQQHNRTDRVARDPVFEAKMEALELVHAAPRSPERQAAFARFCGEEGDALVDFATFCALAERHGTPYQNWPVSLRHPHTSAVARAREALQDRVRLHMWLQWLADEQLTAAQAYAGMNLGIVTDLAVGVDPGGADAWALQAELATGVSVGAPPDAFNRAGQDWGVPPLRPDRLAETGYAPLRRLLAAQMRHGGGVRIDHILGLFRLYWIPEDLPADAGTYVRYPGEDLLGAVALEAERAGAVVIGEDLGTVERGVRDRLAANRVLGSRVVYFEKAEDGDGFRPAEHYPELVLGSVTTHDLPTAAGWWRGEGPRIQRAHGVLDPEDEASAQSELAHDHAAFAELLRREGLLPSEAGHEPTTGELVRAMHAFLARTPSLLVAGLLNDAVGDLRQPNLPGTTEAYPNWRLPVAEPHDDESRPVLLDDLRTHPGPRQLARALARGRK